MFTWKILYYGINLITLQVSNFVFHTLILLVIATLTPTLLGSMSSLATQPKPNEPAEREFFFREKKKSVSAVML